MAEQANGYIDVHCHVIPGVDDGARDLQMALRMVTMAYESGFRGMIATPHFEVGKYDENQEEIVKNLNKLVDLVQKKYPDFQIFLGNEVFYSYGVVDAWDEGRAFTLANSKYVLVEFSPTDSYTHIRNAVYEIINSGYMPIIAHCERYEHVMCNMDNVEELVDAGAYIQINSRTIAGHYGRGIRRKVMKLMKNDLVHFIGTDTHSDGTRNPNLDECLKYLRKKLDEETIYELMVEHPRKILKNEYL